MQVLVVGGTGTLGRQIARRAIDAGHQVRCMVRKPRKGAFLQEWGCELTCGNLLDPGSIDYALDGVDAVIDAATSRPDDSSSVYTTDWDGKLNLLRACEKAGVKRYVFLSLLAAEKHLNVPLMDIKFCTERLLADSSFDYTILQGVAFMQGLIGQIAIPVLENQTVWVSETPTAVAYMNTQDVARFAVAALERPETIRRSFPVVGPKAWTSEEIVQFCEKSSSKTAKMIRVSPFLIGLSQRVVSFFEQSVNMAERLAFAEVTGGGIALDAPMDDTYACFGLDPSETTPLESYIAEYYDTILKRLREMEADLDEESRRKLPF
ncbi:MULTISPECIES: NmrA family NAD(P)-binding protein [unclassified Prochlorococcus]|uniref:NmrA family NAD(P)-binding protein n=1 Tax=unclassified Prochlorococcus TaxID=2627481 RepID=UPI0005339EFC|nr:MULTISPECIES: NmrA family NAD(P)-binding protein [unclassified Prochlorococcus]KGG25633.1 putative chaperon-like protein Ycf39 for quinone binding in Photosystem II [Prochlorococcus sp. MIT 0701]KGG29163.1 putative chaperon-like protein Ycf39 for quinone binding in Photosystem II [Prochlorococcus sp. MIT 0702]KGG32522.1 putative chaperon-like protein Ycf39 for quinone binding in Photosystem II [Prochlorococcus sp. MIT 0703]